MPFFKRRKPQPSQRQLEQAVITYLNTYPWADKKKIVETYSEELLTGAADHVFADLRRKYRGYNKEIRILLDHWSFLDRCRQHGIEAAFADRLRSHKLLDLVEELDKLTSLNEMPRRIELCEEALALVDRSRDPEVWAHLQSELGVSLTLHQLGERADNMERAIEHYHKALEVYTRKSLPEEWADVQNKLGLAYTERIYDNQADNMEKAIEYYHKALEVYTRKAFPEGFAQVQNNLGLTYRNRILGERADNLEKAIECLQKALKFRTRQDFPRQWTITKLNIGGAYVERIHGKRADNLEKAIAHLQQASDDYTHEAFPELWARIENALGAAYVERIHEERADNLEKAIAHFQQTLKVYTREAFPDFWAETQNNLASAYAERIHEKRADNLEEAIEHYKNALEIHTREAYPQKWAIDQGNLAKSYEARIYGPRDDNLKKAIKCYRKALGVCTLEELPALRQWILTGLGYLQFGKQNWEEGFEVYKEAIEVGNTMLAGAYTEVGRKAEVEEAYLLYEHAAYCLLRMGEPSDALLRLEQGKTRLLSEALAMGDVDLIVLPKAQRQAILKARQKIRELEAEMHITSDTSIRRTNVELGDLLHHARADLNRVIKSTRAEHPDFMPTGLDLPRILALIPEGGALVVPLITSQGSAVFVIPQGAKAVEVNHVVVLDRFTHADLDALIIGNDDNPGWIRAYFNMRRRETVTSFERWKEYIDKFTGQLWQILMGSIHNRLIELGLEEGAPIILTPQGRLGVLPLHAAWHQVNGVRRTFLDYYTVSYTPSAYVLEVSYRRIQDKQHYSPTLLAVVNPTADLKYTEVESEMVAGLFTHSTRTILRGRKATQKAIVQQAAGHNYFHFSCHGYYNQQEVMRSGLILANGHPLTLSDIISTLDLSLARLVTLSACETGVTDILQSPNEYVGLPAGFIQAGASGVISSLWAVNDQSTALLMKSFYLSHLEEGMPPAQALRLAQLWLRDATRKELGEYYESFIRMSTNEALEAYGIIMTEGHPDDKPYANPFYWGAFIFTGS